MQKVGKSIVDVSDPPRDASRLLAGGEITNFIEDRPPQPRLCASTIPTCGMA